MWATSKFAYNIKNVKKYKYLAIFLFRLKTKCTRNKRMFTRICLSDPNSWIDCYSILTILCIRWCSWTPEADFWIVVFKLPIIKNYCKQLVKVAFFYSIKIMWRKYQKTFFFMSSLLEFEISMLYHFKFLIKFLFKYFLLENKYKFL